VNVSAPPSISRIANAYGISENTIRDWKKRGITTDDLLDPITLAPKLRRTAKHDSPRLRMLGNRIAVGQIIFRLSIIEPINYDND